MSLAQHQVIQKIKTLKDDLLHLIYPNLCLICENELPAKIENICPFCELELRLTNFEMYNEPSMLDKLFWGRINIKSTCAYLYFEKNSGTQPILHNIKYKGKKDLGIEMGKRFGKALLKNEKFSSIDAIVPVPLHPKKKYIRGYNQSETIAHGISISTGIPLVLDLLNRGVHRESQTKKGKMLRWENVSDAFFADVKNGLTLKHLALVDDVITTGSTLEACATEILKKLPETEISIFSLAIAK
jgi:competence protein ComFC